jgi:hypothetical protein
VIRFTGDLPLISVSTDDLRLDLPPPDLSRSAQLQTIANTNSLTVLIDFPLLITLVVDKILLISTIHALCRKNLTDPRNSR